MVICTFKTTIFDCCGGYSNRNHCHLQGTRRLEEVGAREGFWRCCVTCCNKFVLMMFGIRMNSNKFLKQKKQNIMTWRLFWPVLWRPLGDDAGTNRCLRTNRLSTSVFAARTKLIWKINQIVRTPDGIKFPSVLKCMFYLSSKFWASKMGYQLGWVLDQIKSAKQPASLHDVCCHATLCRSGWWVQRNANAARHVAVLTRPVEQKVWRQWPTGGFLLVVVICHSSGPLAARIPRINSQVSQGCFIVFEGGSFQLLLLDKPNCFNDLL